MHERAPINPFGGIAGLRGIHDRVADGDDDIEPHAPGDGKGTVKL